MLCPASRTTRAAHGAESQRCCIPRGVGYTARTAIRFIDEAQSRASLEERQTGIPLNGGLLKFHSGTLDLHRAWPGFNSTYPDDAIVLLANLYQQACPDERVTLVTRDAAMRCKARAG